MAKAKVKEEVQAEETPQSNTPVVQEQAAPPAVQTPDLASWGKTEVSAKDIIIPRIFLMQPMSDPVTNGEAKFGEFRDSLTNELLGDFEKGFNIVPFHMEKVFVEYDVTKGDDMKNKKFLRITPITPENENLPYQDEERTDNGLIKVTRDRCMNFYVLLQSELENGTAIPYILTARRSSHKAGKKLATQMFVKNMAAGKTPAAVMMTILSKKESNDQGTFAVMDVVPNGPAKDAYVAQAFNWLTMVRSGRAKVDEASYDAEAINPEVPASGSDTSSGPAKF